MSDLETNVCPVLKSLWVEPDPVGLHLNDDDLATQAIWAFKTAIVRNAGTNYRQIVPKEHYTELYNTRGIPDNQFVDLAIFPVHRGKLGALQSQAMLCFVDPSDELLFREAKDQIYNIILGVGPVLLRIVHSPLCGYELQSDFHQGCHTFRLFPNRNTGRLGANVVVSDSNTVWLSQLTVEPNFKKY